MAMGLEPLKITAFRNIFLAQLVSNIGLWMQTVGAQWFLVDAGSSALVISLVQTASLAPTLIFSLLAGVLADVLNVRRLLIVLTGYAIVVAGLMAGLAWSGHLTPVTMLCLTFLLGAGSALSAPAFQAIQPELVPREQIPDAASLGSVAMNTARAVGPALAGFLFSFGGAGTVFAINAASYLAVLAALLSWHRTTGPADVEREHIAMSLGVGLRYVAAAPVVRRLLLRAALFAVPASAVWALLPVVASTRFHLDSTGYGGVLGVVGGGAVVGMLILPSFRSRLSDEVLLVGSSILFAGGALAAGFLPFAAAVAPLALAGFGWTAQLSTLNAALQLTLPQWVRARGMSMYLLVFSGLQGTGALAWGLVGDAIGVGPALGIAGGALLLNALAAVVVPMHPLTARLDRTLFVTWPVPTIVFEPEPSDGPVQVNVRYRVEPENTAAFITAMEALARSRRRTGGRSWRLYRSGETTGEYVEQFVVPSWSEYQRQRSQRWTGYDHENILRVAGVAERIDQRHLFTVAVD
ncbi:MFS transporter [Gordonia sp. VNK21]|uniref:MFS transporter n=1 Tax=Gordonia sp. VNK21 TaxID=3382483 RepID=UPI0038D3F482